MKRIMLLIILILLCSCSSYDISKTLFIASVGIEQAEDKYVGYFYLPLSSDIGKTEAKENKGQGHYAKTKGESIYELFYNLENSSSLTINLNHISSIVLNEKILNDDFIGELLNYIKYSLSVDFNFYLFVTAEKLEDIYSFKNPNQESVLNSLLVSTSDAEKNFLVAKPLHFLCFVRDYYKDRSILFPFLDLEEIWNIESKYEKNFHIQGGIYYYKGKIKRVIKNEGSPYFSSAKSFYDRINENIIYFTRYKMKIAYKERLLINIYLNYEVYNSNAIEEGAVEEHIKKRITSYLEEFNEVDPLNIRYYNYIYNRACSYDNVDIEVIFLNN